ncbi:RagB/SusD family nutrient uptake outer membrane protein, partial [Bacteroides sp. OttesenSCG-928-N06]|nr:RagB/SusD family nutrient uptake outer membrane protein [Bacteroides sp. OttesenSCG-928-N06]
MKRIIYILTLPLILINFVSCDLDEENHSDTTQEFLATQQGFVLGLNSAYSAVRDLFGAEEGMHGLMNPGTDELKCGTSSNRTYDIAHYTPNYNAGNEYPRTLWVKAYERINVLNFLINEGQNTSTGTVLTEAKKKQYTGEAKYLRAWFYFNLVQQFGDVTLNTEYNTKPSQSATRHDMLEVYNLIVKDLTEASTECLPSPQQNSLESGRASGAAARHLLTRVYLTLGWVHDKDASAYPNNPHNKYHDTAKAKDYFTKAYNTANSLINDAASLGLSLMPEYKDVFDEKNDAPSGKNKEELFVVRMDWDMDNTFGGRSTLNHYYVNGYEAYLGERNINDGRCYSWNNPNNYTYNTFTMRDKDTRYNATFQTVWYATKIVNGGKVTYKIDGVDETFEWKQTTIGDTALYYPGYKMTADEIRAKTQNRGDKNKYVIFTPEAYEGLKIFPTMMKYLDRTRNNFNDNSDRSIIASRLGETYLLGAEAAFKLGDNDNAARLINVVRERARNKETSQAGDLNIKPADVTLDYILEERTRELLAEHCRWADLVRTGTLLERVRKYNDNFAKDNIQDKHILRPIPQQ